MQDGRHDDANDSAAPRYEAIELGALVALIVVTVIVALTLTTVNFSATLWQLDRLLSG